MADDQMLMRIVLDASNLEQGMTRLRIFETEVRKGVGTFGDFKNIVANAELQLQKLYATQQINEKQYDRTGRALQLMHDRAATGFTSISNAASRALPAVNEFTRIIADSPYGLRGMANNVQQLATLFGSLSVQAGGSRLAIKEMVAMMVGPAGVVLAVNAIVSIAVALESKLFPSAKKTRQAAEDLNETLLKLGEITPSDYIGSLIKEINLLNLELDKLQKNKSFFDSGKANLSGRGSDWIYNIFGPSKQDVDNAQKESADKRLKQMSFEQKRQAELNSANITAIKNEETRDRKRLEEKYRLEKERAGDDKVLKEALDRALTAEKERLAERFAKKREEEAKKLSDTIRKQTQSDYWELEGLVRQHLDSSPTGGAIPIEATNAKSQGQALAKKMHGGGGKSAALAQNMMQADFAIAEEQADAVSQIRNNSYKNELEKELNQLQDWYDEVKRKAHNNEDILAKLDEVYVQRKKQIEEDAQKEIYDDALRKHKMFVKAFERGVSAMVNNLSPISDAFASIFGGAQTLLGSFADAFAKTMIDLGTKYAIGSLFNLIGGGVPGFFTSIGGGILSSLGFKMAGGGIIGEPVVGMGLRSGASYAFGENGPEMVIPNNQLMASRFADRRGPQVVVLESRIKGSDLVLVHSKASVDRAGRIM